MRITHFSLSLVIFLLINLSASHAVTVYFQNGDRLSGELISLDSSQTTIKPNAGGEVTFNTNKVKSLETDQTVTVRFKSNRYLTGKIKPRDNAMIVQVDKRELTRTFGVEEIDQIFLEDPRNKLKKKLSVNLDGELNLGASQQEGNTNKESYHTDGRLRARTLENRYTLSFEYNQEQTNDQLTEENSTVFGKYDHFLSPKWFMYTSSTFEQNTFENLELLSNFSMGMGYQFLETEKRLLSFETGASYTNETYEDTTPSENSLGIRYALNYERQVYESTELFHFQEGLLGSGDEGDFDFRSRTGLRFPLAGGFQSTLQFKLDWNQEPTSGNVSTDRKYLLTLGYRF